MNKSLVPLLITCNWGGTSFVLASSNSVIPLAGAQEKHIRAWAVLICSKHLELSFLASGLQIWFPNIFISKQPQKHLTGSLCSRTTISSVSMCSCDFGCVLVFLRFRFCVAGAGSTWNKNSQLRNAVTKLATNLYDCVIFT